MNRRGIVAGVAAVAALAAGFVVGQVSDDGEPSPSAATVEFNPCPPQHYLVQSGDTFSIIAARLGVDARKLGDANGTTAGSRPSLTTKRLAGSCIIVPASPPPSTTTTSPSSTALPSTTSTTGISSTSIVSLPSSTTTSTLPPSSTSTTSTTSPSTSSSSPSTTSTTPSASSTTTSPATTSSTSIPPTTTSIPQGPLQPIADNFTVTNELVRPWDLPGGSDEGKFRTECAASAKLNYDDPIVYPSNPGQAHLHNYFGNLGTNAASTYESLRTTGESTCAGGKLNRTAYWYPAMLDGARKVRIPETITVYYACSSFPTSACSSFQEMPPGLKMISGFDMANPVANAENVKHYRWSCNNSAGTETRSGGAVMPVCNVGEHLYIRMDFPSCWDGLRIDSANHRDHMAHADYRTGTLACPPGYPVKLPTVTLQIHWIVTGTSTATWKLSSDTMPGMSHLPGETWHSDWMNGWSPDIMTTWMNGCVKSVRSCVFSQIGSYQGQGARLKEPTPYTGPKVVDPPAPG